MTFGWLSRLRFLMSVSLTSRTFLTATSSPFSLPRKTAPCAPLPNHCRSVMFSKGISQSSEIIHSIFINLLILLCSWTFLVPIRVSFSETRGNNFFFLQGRFINWWDWALIFRLMTSKHTWYGKAITANYNSSSISNKEMQYILISFVASSIMSHASLAFVLVTAAAVYNLVTYLETRDMRVKFF